MTSPTERPGGKHWDKVERWLDENRVALESARQGGMRPRIGFVFNDPDDHAWLAKVHIDPASIDPNNNEMLISLALPQINEIWLLEHLLEADAWRALSAGDRQAFLDDVEALIGMAEQLRRDVAFLVVDLTSYAVFERALVVVDKALIRHSEVLRDEDLAHLAHRIAGFASGGPIIPRLSGERAYFHDFVQRICSDDGAGWWSVDLRWGRIAEKLRARITRADHGAAVPHPPVGAFGGRDSVPSRNGLARRCAVRSG